MKRLRPAGHDENFIFDLGLPWSRHQYHVLADISAPVIIFHYKMSPDLSSYKNIYFDHNLISRNARDPICVSHHKTELTLLSSRVFYIGANSYKLRAHHHFYLNYISDWTSVGCVVAADIDNILLAVLAALPQGGNPQKMIHFRLSCVCVCVCVSLGYI